MPAEVNKHGLRRDDLHEDQKRAVRQRCGFGCVVCGSALIEYHHFDPPFSDARQHRVEGITLLCGGCHTKVTRRVWSDDKIRKHDAKPYAHNHPPHELLDLKPPLSVIIGSILLTGSGDLITIHGRPLLKLHPREGEGMVLSATLLDAHGDPAIEIVENELRFCAKAWDATMIGPRIRVRHAPRNVAVDMQLYPPHGLHIRRVNFPFPGGNLKTDKSGKIELLLGGRPAIHFVADHVLRINGGLKVEQGKVEITATGLIPFPAKRFQRLIRSGEFSQILTELHAPILHVREFRKPRRPPLDVEALRMTGGPEGKARYRIVCEVCNETELGHRDLLPAQRPPSTSGHICSQCVALAPDGWCIQGPPGVPPYEVQEFAEAKELATTLQTKWPSIRVIVHHADGRLEFIPM